MSNRMADRLVKSGLLLALCDTGLRGRSALTAISVTIGGLPVEVVYAGEQPNFAGLDQLNLRVPRSLAGRMWS